MRKLFKMLRKLFGSRSAGVVQSTDKMNLAAAIYTRSDC
jgi:hypothetical protein